MTYDPQKTPGGNGWLGPNGTFAQFVDGLKWIATNRDSLDEAIQAQMESLNTKLFNGGNFPDGSSPDAVRTQRKAWTVPSSAVSTGTGWPQNFTQGVLVSYGHTGFQYLYGYGFPPVAYYRACNSVSRGTWTDWAPIHTGTAGGPFVRGVFPDTSSPDNVRMEQGLWTVPPSAVSTGSGWPANFSRGVLLSLGDVGHQIAMGGYGTSERVVSVRWCTSVSGGTWTDWAPLAGSAGVPATFSPEAYAVERAARVSEALQRVGHKIGTGGRAVFMLRFDDYPDTLMSKVLPVLQKYDLPGYWAATVNHVENLSSVSWGTLNDTAVQNGLQMTGHSWSHGNATDDAGIRKEIIGSADYFEQQMPACRIDVWTQPSVGGTVPYDGYDSKTGTLHSTLAGKMLLSRYAVINGAQPGFYHSMGGGADAALLTANLTYESHTFESFKGYVDEGVGAGTATDLMLHPGRLDTSGYMTSETFDQCMAYLAQLRDSGKILLLSGLAKAALDAGSTYRQDVLGTNFAGGASGWWKGTATDGVLAVTGQDTATKNVHVDRYTGLRGSVREVVFRVRSSTANVINLTVKATDSSFTVSKDYPLPGDGQWHTFRKFLMIPFDTGSVYLQHSLRSSAGTAFHLAEAHSYAA